MKIDNKELSLAASIMGKKGGKTIGQNKIRGDSEYYSKISRMREGKKNVTKRKSMLKP